MSPASSYESKNTTYLLQLLDCQVSNAWDHLLAPTSCRDSDTRIKDPEMIIIFSNLNNGYLKNVHFRMQNKYITVHDAYQFHTHRGFAISNAGICGIVKSLYGPTSLDQSNPKKNWRINVELIDSKSIHEEIFLRFWCTSNDILNFPLMCQGDFICVGGCEFETVTSFGTLIYKISHFAVKKNNLFLIRNWRIPELISSKENLSNSNESWSDFIDVVCHEFLVRASLTKAEKANLKNSEFITYSASEPEKLKIVKLTMEQENSLQDVVNQLADTCEWPLQFLDYQYKGVVAAMSIIKNSYGKWLHVTLKLYTDNAETNSVTRRSHRDARVHRNNLLMNHIQENESNVYTKITDIEHSSETSDFSSDSSLTFLNDHPEKSEKSGYFINFLVSPEVSFFLLNMEIRPSLHMVVISEHLFCDKNLNSFHINTHTRKNFVWVGLRSDKLFAFP